MAFLRNRILHILQTLSQTFLLADNKLNLNSLK